MSSDYGDFCRAQRAVRSSRNQENFRRNSHQIRERLRDVPELTGIPRDDGTVWRLLRRGVVLDYWPHTGTALVISQGPYHAEKRQQQSGNRVVKWVKQMSRRVDAQSLDT